MPPVRSVTKYCRGVDCMTTLFPETLESTVIRLESGGTRMNKARWTMTLMGVVLAFALWGHSWHVKSHESPPANVLPQWPWVNGGFAQEKPHFVSVPFPTKTIADSNLPQGQRLVIQPGRMGTDFWVNGTNKVIFPPIPQIVALGTAPVHVITINGVKYSYDRVFTALTTAYNGQFSMNGPWGAVAAWDGLPLHQGDVAVDPQVIPLGTYLYIDGFGPARAVDTGSAIFGDHIDIFFPESAQKIAEYGIQFHKVYVLTSRPPNYHG
nr:3D domain-containing protein [Sulfobacillus thermosulfidooxidans]